MDRQAELLRLEQANTHIVTAEKNVSEQRIQLERLRQDGHDDELAETTLKTFEATLETLRQHREMIIKIIEQIDKGLA